MKIFIRSLKASDDAALGRIICSALEEFGANHPGTVYFEEATHHLSQVFVLENSHYTVVELNGEVVGGAGIYPTKGLPSNTCELVKMYLSPEARGLGLGKRLMDNALLKAMESGFEQVYLESMPELGTAVKFYESIGFEHLREPLGDTGHFGCEIRMLKKLLP